MKIEKTNLNGKLTLKPLGRIDTTTAPEFAAAIVYDGISEIDIDLSEVDYISSAGLRVFLATQQKMEAVNGKMVLMNAKQIVLDIFDIAGFTDFFTFA